VLLPRLASFRDFRHATHHLLALTQAKPVHLLDNNKSTTATPTRSEQPFKFIRRDSWEPRFISSTTMEDTAEVDYISLLSDAEEENTNKSSATCSVMLVGPTPAWISSGRREVAANDRDGRDERSGLPS
jgi:hypothetical protein